MAFKDIALPMAQRGVRQVPSLNPRDRFPGPKGWPQLASTGEAQILAWSSNGYADYNSCSVADDNIAIIDVDNDSRAEALGMPAKKTFAVQTPSGGFHLYYKQTERSRALGNRAIPGVVEFKCHSAGVAAPGSIRDDKPGEYTIYKDAPIADFPNELVDWLEKHTSGRSNRNATPVADDFNFDEWLDHYGITGNQNGSFFITDVCPYAGYKHSGSKATGFYWDGDHLGFKCFSDDCQVSIGDVIRHLNETHEPFRSIWPEETSIEDTDWVDTESYEITTKSETPIDMNIESAHESSESALTSSETVLNSSETIKITSIEHLNAIADDLNGVEFPELRFPYNALSPGRFKDLVDKACEGGVQHGLVVPALMTLASAIPSYDVHDYKRIVVFTCLLAKVGAGKDVAINRARLTLGLDNSYRDKFWIPAAPPGEKILAMTIGDKPQGKGKDPIPGPKHTCLISKELMTILNKGRSESSTLFQYLQELYDENYRVWHNSQTGQKITVDCRMSWLTALPIGNEKIELDTFRNAFGDATGGGIFGRLWFGFAEERINAQDVEKWDPPVFSHWVPGDEKIIEGFEESDVPVQEMKQGPNLVQQLMTSRVNGWAPGVEALYRAWRPERDWSGRDTHFVHIVAIITALLNGHELIDQDDWNFTVAFMVWQGKIRETFRAGRSKTMSGELVSTILAAVRKYTKKYQTIGTHGKFVKEVDGHIFLRWPHLSHNGEWASTYGGDIEKTVDSVVRAGDLRYLVEVEFNEDGSEKKRKENKKWVRLTQ